MNVAIPNPVSLLLRLLGLIILIYVSATMVLAGLIVMAWVMATLFWKSLRIRWKSRTP